MEEFSITTRLSKKDYSKLMIIGLYKKPVFMITTISGLYLLATVIFDHAQLIHYYSEPPYFELISGLFILALPFLLATIAIKQFASNPSFRNDIKYTFADSGLSVEGITFKGEFLWTHFIKQKEINKFLILYQSNKKGIFIDKTKLTAGQLEFIRSKITQK